MNAKPIVAIVLAWAAMQHGAMAAPASAEAVEARNQRTVERAFDRWAAGSGNLFQELLADEVVWTIEGSGPSARSYRGRAAFIAEAVRPFAARMTEPVRPVATRVWADGDHVIVNWHGEGVAKDGLAYRNRYVWIFRMRGDVAVEATAFLDLPAYDDVLRRIDIEREHNVPRR